MADAPKFPYYLTEKQVRTLVDVLTVQIRFFNKTLRPADVRYLTKLRESLLVKRLKSSHARPIGLFSEEEE